MTVRELIHVLSGEPDHSKDVVVYTRCLETGKKIRWDILCVVHSAFTQEPMIVLHREEGA